MKNYLKDLKWGRFNLIDGDMISQISSRYGEWADVAKNLKSFIFFNWSNFWRTGTKRRDFITSKLYKMIINREKNKKSYIFLIDSIKIIKNMLK